MLGSFASSEVVTYSSYKIPLKNDKLNTKSRHGSCRYVYTYTRKIKINVITYNNKKSG